jgi:hypothetical protein
MKINLLNLLVCFVVCLIFASFGSQINPDYGYIVGGALGGLTTSLLGFQILE